MFYRALENTLSCIKDRFLECEEIGGKAFEEGDVGHHIKKGYILRNPAYNFNRSMSAEWYKDLEEGMEDKRDCCYIASSYAMICNILGRQPIKLRENYANITPGIYKRQNNEKCRTINCKNALVSFDVVIQNQNKKELIFFDSKMLEWFVFKVNPLKDTFLRKEHYYCADAAKEFIAVFQKLIPFYEKGKWEHKSIFRYYDGFTSVRQLLGLYNLYKFEGEEGISRKIEAAPLEKQQSVEVVYCYWMAEHPEKFGNYKQKICNAEKRMHKEFLFFRQCIRPIQKLFQEQLGIDLKIELVRYDDLIEGVEKAEDHQRYLQRYYI